MSSNTFQCRLFEWLLLSDPLGAWLCHVKEWHALKTLQLSFLWMTFRKAPFSNVIPCFKNSTWITLWMSQKTDSKSFTAKDLDSLYLKDGRKISNLSLQLYESCVIVAFVRIFVKTENVSIRNCFEICEYLFLLSASFFCSYYVHVQHFFFFFFSEIEIFFPFSEWHVIWLTFLEHFFLKLWKWIFICQLFFINRIFYFFVLCLFVFFNLTKSSISFPKTRNKKKKIK